MSLTRLLAILCEAQLDLDGALRALTCLPLITLRRELPRLEHHTYVALLALGISLSALGLYLL